MLQRLSTYRTHATIDELKATEKAQIKKHKLTDNMRKVYSCLVKHSFNGFGACTLKGQTIADELGISRSTVTRCIKKLKDLHVIEVHNNAKGNGIVGANIYAIIFLTHSDAPNEPTEMTQRATHETPRSSKVDTHKIESESLSFNLCSNPFVVKNVVNNVNACASTTNLKQLLREIYQPLSVEDNRNFEELSKIAFGRLKQYMKSHDMPYLQMEQIIIRCMHSLVAKEGVRSQFAMYSKMIERQVLQLFEQPIEPQINKREPQVSRNKEKVPDWFEKRNDERSNACTPSTAITGEIDFEAERQKILAKIGG